MKNESNPLHCAGYGQPHEKKITLRLDVTEEEYRQLANSEIFFALSVDDSGNLDTEKFTSDEYPDVA